MPKITGTKNARNVGNPSGFNFFLSYTARDRTISGTSAGQHTTNDVLFDDFTSSTIAHEADVNINPIPSASTITFISANTAIATVNQNGNLTYVADGTAKINVTIKVAGKPKLTKQISIPVSSTGGGTTSVFNSYVAGSLGKHCSDFIDNAILGLTADDAHTIAFSSDTDPTYVWNTSCWLYGTNMTCVSPHNSVGGLQRAGFVLTPTTIGIANHFNYGAGTVVTFIAQDGTRITRNVIDGRLITGTDIFILSLDSALPASIKPVKLLPTNYAHYMPSLSSTLTIPCVGFIGGGIATGTQPFPDGHLHKTPCVRELSKNDSNDSMAQRAPSTEIQRYAFGVDYARSGDSGNPNFLVINGDLVILHTLYGPYDGDSYAALHDTIDAAVFVLTGEHIVDVDLSGFNFY